MAEPDPNKTRVEGDASALELRSLIHDASPGRILAAVHGRDGTPTGKKPSYSSTTRWAGMNSPTRILETRAQTEAPANVSTQQAEIIQPIFGQTAAPAGSVKTVKTHTHVTSPTPVLNAFECRMAIPHLVR